MTTSLLLQSSCCRVWRSVSRLAASSLNSGERYIKVRGSELQLDTNCTWWQIYILTNTSLCSCPHTGWKSTTVRAFSECRNAGEALHHEPLQRQTSGCCTIRVHTRINKTRRNIKKKMAILISYSATERRETWRGGGGHRVARIYDKKLENQI